MQTLDRAERLRLMKFVCSFAWTDLAVTHEERALVERMVASAEFDQAERQQVARWLEVPPRPEEVDPTEIPFEHREVFLRAAREMVAADGMIVEGERDVLQVFEELVREGTGP